MKKVCTTTARVAQPSSAVRSLCSQLAFVGILFAIPAFAQQPPSDPIHAQTPSKPDLIFINADIYLGVTNDLGVGFRGAQVTRVEAQSNGRPCMPDARGCSNFRDQAIAVKDGRVLTTGTNLSVQQLAGPHTQIIDLHGHFVMPGFNDAHAHLANAGFEKLNVSLIGTKSLAEMQSRIAARAKSAAPGEWIIGRGWDHTLWPAKVTPTRQDLDKVTGDHPAIFGRVD